jgi:MFS family permease
LIDVARPDRTVASLSAWPMWVLGLTFFVDAVDQNVVRGIVPQLKHAFGVGDLAIGVLMSAFVLVNGLVTLPAGYIADRWVRTRTVGVTVAVWSVVSAAGAMAPTYGVLVAMRGVLGFGQGVTDPSASSLLPDYYELERRGRAFSVQQCLTFTGTGIGVAVGGLVGPTLGWRAAFVIISVPGLVVAYLALHLREPKRGAADRKRLGISDRIEFVEDEPVAESGAHLQMAAPGMRRFTIDLLVGLRRDVRVILAIPTLRFALVGVSALLFTITAVGSWMPEFYQRQLGLSQARATGTFLVMVMVGGISGVTVGGRIADRWATRMTGARVVIPGVALIAATTLFIVSLLRLPFALCIPIQLVGFFFATLAIPALRAGLTDAVPATLRGTGFGAFNLASVLFGTAAAPLVTSFFSQKYGDNLRTAFLIVLPVAYIGAGLLIAARKHLEVDTQRLFQTVSEAMERRQSEV